MAPPAGRLCCFALWYPLCFVAELRGFTGLCSYQNVEGRALETGAGQLTHQVSAPRYRVNFVRVASFGKRQLRYNSCTKRFAIAKKGCCIARPARRDQNGMEINLR